MNSSSVSAQTGTLLYERLLPAVADSVASIRLELIATLERHGMGDHRRHDIELVISEAATNVVLHAYEGRASGPLYVAAFAEDETVTIAIADHGSGMRVRDDSPGLGVGIALMTQLSDELQVHSDPAVGLCLNATFREAMPARAVRPALTPAAPRTELYREYLRVLGEVHASLADDTEAVIAQARQTVAHTRRARLARHKC